MIGFFNFQLLYNLSLIKLFSACVKQNTTVNSHPDKLSKNKNLGNKENDGVAKSTSKKEIMIAGDYSMGVRSPETIQSKSDAIRELLEMTL